MASAELPTQSKGNSLAVSLDGKYLLLGTQGRNAKVYSIPVPAKVTPSPSPSSTDGQSDVEAAGPGRRGTLLALGVAAAVAVVAGVVAGVIRDR